MKLLWILLSLSMLSSSVFANVVIDGFKMPESVAQDKDGNIYVSEIGERDVDKDGKITMIDKSGKRITIVDDLYDPPPSALDTPSFAREFTILLNFLTSTLPFSPTPLVFFM